MYDGKGRITCRIGYSRKTKHECRLKPVIAAQSLTLIYQFDDRPDTSHQEVTKHISMNTSHVYRSMLSFIEAYAKWLRPRRIQGNLNIIPLQLIITAVFLFQSVPFTCR
jgi:hypothetical protein